MLCRPLIRAQEKRVRYHYTNVEIICMIICNYSEPCKFQKMQVSRLRKYRHFLEFIWRSYHMSKRKAAQQRFCEWGSE